MLTSSHSKWPRSDFRGLPRMTSKLTPKLSFWPQKWLCRAKQSLLGSLWGRLRNPLFEHFWVSFELLRVWGGSRRSASSQHQARQQLYEQGVWRNEARGAWQQQRDVLCPFSNTKEKHDGRSSRNFREAFVANWDFETNYLGVPAEVVGQKEFDDLFQVFAFLPLCKEPRFGKGMSAEDFSFPSPAFHSTAPTSSMSCLGCRYPY